MENNLILDEEINGIEILPISKSYILEAAKWGKFISIVGFVISILFLLIFFFGSIGLFFDPNFSEELQYEEDLAIGFGAVVFFCLSTISFTLIPSFYLYRFSMETIRAVNKSSSENLMRGFKNLKSLLKYVGILIIVGIALYILIIMAIIYFGVSSTL